MASIERTAYPRFKRLPTTRELTTAYTPTAEECAFVERSARGASRQLTVIVLLKTFQHLGYMPSLQDVPEPIIAHLRTVLRLPDHTVCGYDSRRTMY